MTCMTVSHGPSILSGQYRCPACGNEFGSDRDLYLHMHNAEKCMREFALNCIDRCDARTYLSVMTRIHHIVQQGEAQR